MIRPPEFRIEREARPDRVGLEFEQWFLSVSLAPKLCHHARGTQFLQSRQLREVQRSLPAFSIPSFSYRSRSILQLGPVLMNLDEPPAGRIRHALDHAVDPTIRTLGTHVGCVAGQCVCAIHGFRVGALEFVRVIQLGRNFRPNADHPEPGNSLPHALAFRFRIVPSGLPKSVRSESTPVLLARLRGPA